ncbi:MAG: amino acid ABC transporter permease [Pseudonocardia sp.]|nr:amino acid ABC transporter permease [Pseudonocardia sp.]
MSSVLYDAPGPRARRNTLVGTVIAGIVLAALAVLVVIQLGNNDQLDGAKWGPLYNPANPYFVATWGRLLSGLVVTIQAAAITLVLALAIGTLLVVMRVTSARAFRWIVVTFIEGLRGLPVVVTIFFAARVLPELGLTLPPLWYVVIGLTAYNCVIIAEILRSGINALPRGQAEAANALGMSRLQVLRLILLPQAFRLMLPALISQLVVIVKDTSLGFVVFGFADFVREANTVIQFFGGQLQISFPLQMFLTVALVFILINYGLGKLAEYINRRGSRLSRRRPPDPAMVELEVAESVTTGRAG